MLEPTSESVVRQGLAVLRDRQGDYEKFRRYYHGEHSMRFASEKYRNAFGHLFNRLSLNLCRGVVNAPADRLEVKAFSVEEGDKALADAAWSLWQRNRMDLRAGKVHKHSLRAGNAYAIVWPDRDGQPVIHPNKANCVTVTYDEDRPSVVVSAVKAWTVATYEDGKAAYRLRVTVYYPDRIEKYVTASSTTASGLPDNMGMFERYEVPGEPWPLLNPWGVVPVFHFANDEEAAEGYSELVDAIPLQDALNKTIYDKMVAMEFEAFAQRWAVGLEVDVDETTGRARQPFEPGVDRVWAVASEDVKFGEFSRADLSGFLAVEKEYKLSIAQVSGTPLHYLALMTDPPSGEALKTLEARFVKKVKDRQTAFGAQWQELMALALRMAGQGRDKVRLVTQWEDPATRSAKMDWEVLAMKAALGVDTATILQEGGYGEVEARRMAVEFESKQAALSEAQIKVADNAARAAS